MNLKKRLLSLGVSVALLAAMALPASAASYVSGSTNATPSVSANGSMGWTQTTGIMKATTTSSGAAGVTVQLYCDFVDASGHPRFTYDGSTKSGTNTISDSAGNTPCKGYKYNSGWHTALYAGGSWGGGTNLPYSN